MECTEAAKGLDQRTDGAYDVPRALLGPVFGCRENCIAGFTFRVAAVIDPLRKTRSDR
jgi:hypothetical protein